MHGDILQKIKINSKFRFNINEYLELVHKTIALDWLLLYWYENFVDYIGHAVIYPVLPPFNALLLLPNISRIEIERFPNSPSVSELGAFIIQVSMCFVLFLHTIFLARTHRQRQPAAFAQEIRIGVDCR